MDEEQNEEQKMMGDSNLKDDLKHGIQNVNNVVQQGKKAKNDIESAANTAKNIGKSVGDFGKNLQNNGLPKFENFGQKINIPNQSNNPPLQSDNGFKMPFSRRKLTNNSSRLKNTTNVLKTFIKLKGKKFLIIGGIVLIVLLLFLCIFVIIDGERQKEDGTYKEGDKSNVPYIISSMVMDRLVIVSDSSGKYVYAFEDDNGEIVDLDEELDNALETLSANGSTASSYLGKNKKKKKELLKKMIQAEIATQYPSLDESEDLGYTNTIAPYTTSSVSGCDTNLDVTVSENFITDYDTLHKALASYNDKMAEHTQDFLDFQEKYGVNAIFCAAVFIWETSGGTTSHAVDGCNNWGNISTKSDPLAIGYLPKGEFNWAIYPDVRTGIEAEFYLIGERSENYVAGGNKTIAQIFLRYNKDDTSEPGKVAQSMAKMYSVAGITSLTSSSQTGVGTTAKGNKTGDTKIDEKIDEDKTVKGGIVVQRKDENGEVKTLKYTSTDNFDALLMNNTDEALNYYTLKRNVAGTTSGASSSSISDFSGSTNAEITWNFLRGKGLSEVCTAAIIGNLMQESSPKIDPTMVESGSGDGYGIAQWSYGRRTQLRKYAETIGRDVEDIEVQLEFLWMETDPNAERNGADLQWTKQSYQQFIAMSSIEEATKFFCSTWERAGKPNMSNRLKYANETYAQYNGGSSSNSTNAANSTTSSDSSTQSKITTLDDFLFVGDSRYAGIKSELSALGSNINVIGVSSSSSSNWVTATKEGNGIVLSTNVTLPTTVSGVSVMLGVNNLSQVTETQEVLNNLHTKYPNVPIIFNSVYHVGVAYANAEEMNKNIDKFNEEMKSFCSKNSWANYIDINNNLNDDSGYLKSADSSGIHIEGSEAKGILVNNIKSGILGTSSSSGTNNSNTTSNAKKEGYSIVVANKKTVTTTVTDVYTYKYTQSNTAFESDSHSNLSPTSTTSSSTTYSSSSVNYQESLKNYTLYFDFLWAVLVNTDNSKFITKWANLVCDNVGKDSKLYITVYSESNTSNSSSTTNKPTVSSPNPKGGNDIFSVTETTNIETKTLDSKLAVTYADTWLLKYENDADSYSEFQAKTKEVVTEKLDKDAKENNIIKLLRKNKKTLKSMTNEEYIVDDMIKDNEKVSFMVDIYGYILDVANGKVKVDENQELAEKLDISLFDLQKFRSQTGTSIALGDFNGDFLEVARKCHAYVRENGFTYVQGQSIPITSKSSGIDCSSYVCWVLYEYGYTDRAGWQLSCSGGTLVAWCKSNLELVYSGYAPSITEVANIEPGDIVIQGERSQAGGDSSHHTQIFVGYDENGKAIWYNCGSNNAIKTMEGNERYNSTDSSHGNLYVFRVPKK